MKKLINKYGEVIRYLIIGVLTTVVSLATYYLCVHTILNASNAIELQIANIISWVVSVTFAFFTNRSYVFKSKNTNVGKEAIDFYISRIATLLIDMSLMFVFVTLLHCNDTITKLIVQFIIIVLNYIFSRIFVFKNA